MVETGEDRKLSELRDASHHEEANRPGVDLELLVEVVQNRADPVQRRNVVEELGDRFVVFVDEDDDLLRWRLRGSATQEGVKIHSRIYGLVVLKTNLIAEANDKSCQRRLELFKCLAIRA